MIDNYFLFTGRMGTGMIANLWDSSVTFRRGTAEKASFILLNQFDLTLTVLAVYLGLSELNPLIRELVNIPILLLTVKLALPFQHPMAMVDSST